MSFQGHWGLSPIHVPKASCSLECLPRGENLERHTVAILKRESCSWPRFMLPLPQSSSKGSVSFEEDSGDTFLTTEGLPTACHRFTPSYLPHQHFSRLFAYDIEIRRKFSNLSCLEKLHRLLLATWSHLCHPIWFQRNMGSSGRGHWRRLPGGPPTGNCREHTYIIRAEKQNVDHPRFTCMNKKSLHQFICR